MREVRAEMDAVRRSNPDLMEVAAREAFPPQRPRSVSDATPRRALGKAFRRPAAPSFRRSAFRVGIPRVLALYQYAPFFGAYLESLGVDPGNIVYSDETGERLYREGARRGAIDPCYPSKVVIPHLHNLIYAKHRARRLDCVFLPMIEVVTPPLVGTLASYSCPMVSTAPEVVKAAFTKESDVFREHGIVFLSPILNHWGR